MTKRQDTVVAWTTFYRVAGLKSLANHQLRSYYTHKVWCGGADEGLIECGKAHEWFTDYFNSELVTVCKGRHLRDTIQGGLRSSLLSFRTILIITLSFYILFLIPSFLIHPHKLFSMQLGPDTASLACARLIVPFAPFSGSQDSAQTRGHVELICATMSPMCLNTSALSDPNSLCIPLVSPLVYAPDYLQPIPI